MLEGAKAADERESRKGKTEGASSKKISIRHLGRGFHFTAGRGLSSPGSDVVPAPALPSPLRELVSQVGRGTAVGDAPPGRTGLPPPARRQHAADAAAVGAFADDQVLQLPLDVDLAARLGLLEAAGVALDGVD